MRRGCCVALLLVLLAFQPQSWARRGRLRRHLVWPDAGPVLELILGLALPANVQGQDYTVGATMKIDYDLPSNATQLLGQAAERALGRLTRWQLYATAEAALSRPSTTDSGSSEGRRYLAAEHAGTAAGGGGGGGGEGCAALYRECAASPLHYLTVLTSS
ncbi:uncharacterized protein LOC126281779 isoform X2 [Schistocerca gregaria]|uniref:uncharacterized protein LOC126281779 isoform X2 n=1 Tax=Schistocerca gregaria TaxID=7010 RepID=UPI00211E202D|nr:uncharacterized protein LOC126281779 isoform X2 [Schistocerca gregaria]